MKVSKSDDVQKHLPAFPPACLHARTHEHDLHVKALRGVAWSCVGWDRMGCDVMHGQ